MSRDCHAPGLGAPRLPPGARPLRLVPGSRALPVSAGAHERYGTWECTVPAQRHPRSRPGQVAQTGPVFVPLTVERHAGW